LIRTCGSDQTYLFYDFVDTVLIREICCMGINDLFIWPEFLDSEFIDIDTVIDQQYGSCKDRLIFLIGDQELGVVDTVIMTRFFLDVIEFIDIFREGDVGVFRSDIVSDDGVGEKIEVLDRGFGDIDIESGHRSISYRGTHIRKRKCVI